MSGRAASQVSRTTGELFSGGGFQIRFLDFDEKWIVKTKKIKG